MTVSGNAARDDQKRSEIFNTAANRQIMAVVPATNPINTIARTLLSITQREWSCLTLCIENP